MLDTCIYSTDADVVQYRPMCPPYARMTSKSLFSRLVVDETHLCIQHDSRETAGNCLWLSARRYTQPQSLGGNSDAASGYE